MACILWHASKRGIQNGSAWVPWQADFHNKRKHQESRCTNAGQKKKRGMKPQLQKKGDLRRQSQSDSALRRQTAFGV